MTAVPIDNLSFIPGLNLDDARFTVSEIRAAEATLAEFISAQYPALDLSPGTTLYDLIVRPQAIIYLTNRAQVKAVQATMSIQGLQNNPALVSDNVIDAVLSNFSVTRKPGQRATGLVRVNVSRSTSYAISISQTFTTSVGLRFHPTQSFRAVPDPQEGQLKLYTADQLSNQFYFLVPVEAEASGVLSQLSSDVEVTPTLSIPNFIVAFSFGAFTGGEDSESNDELVARLPVALSAKNLVSRLAIRTELFAKFPAVRTVGVQGFGDAALTRGASNILGIKSGGFADIWVRVGSTPQRVIVEKTAYQVSTEADGRGLYSCLINERDMPGHYFVSAVRPPEPIVGVESQIGTFPIQSQSKGTMTLAPAKIGSPAESAYSTYQTSQVFFYIDPNSQALTSELPVSIELLGQPSIQDIQEWISAPDVRPAGTDYLVRAAIPCFVACSPITVHLSGDANLDAVRVAIFNYITNLAVGADLSVDGIVLAARSVPGVDRVELPIRLSGQIFLPDGTSSTITSENSLKIPSRPLQQLIAETCVFFIDLDDIPLNAIRSN